MATQRATHILKMSDKKEKNIRIRLIADNALDEIEKGEIDLTKKEIASRAIMSYYKVWKARRNAQTVR